MFVALVHRWWNSGKPTSSSALNSNIDVTTLDEKEINSYFNSAASFLPSITDRVNEQVLLRLYGLYKLATMGPPTSEDKPSFYDVRGKKKFQAWSDLKGLSPRDAMGEYILEIDSLGLGWNPNVSVNRQTFGKLPSRPAVEEPEETKVETTEALWFLSCQNDDLEVAERLLANDSNLLNMADKVTELTALHWAIDKGSKNVAKWLIDCGADVDIQDPDGNTPLHYAAYCTQYEIAQHLLAHGANSTIRNEDDSTPQECAENDDLKVLLAVDLNVTQRSKR
ncbi:unnamed protein product, partial [Mesorhabditis belari]|uniref:Acyl-CoA-binding domain-containing protein 6 n=1 Tax=Mesorhabditis belari TaxID=2138241 RepID=A0AAF3FH47_9BILA